MKPMAFVERFMPVLEKPLMKKALLLVFVSMLISSAWASHIGIQTFAPGEMLSASKLNSNFSALNNGKQDRVTGECDTGSSIRVINADGTVVCEADSGLTSVTSADIVDGDVKGVDLGSGSVSNIKLGSNSVTTDKIKDGSVRTADILDGTIALIDMGGNSVNSSRVVDGSLTAADLGPGSVGPSELATGSVVGGTGGDIADNTITAADIASGAVAGDEIQKGVIVDSHISSLSAGIITGMPGIEFASLTSFSASAPATIERVMTITINIPGPGYVVASFNGYALLSHTTAIEEYIDIGINTTTNPSINFPVRIRVPSSAPLGSYRFTASRQEIFDFSASAAGSKVINVDAWMSRTTNTLFFNNFVAVFYPVRY